MLLPLLLNFKMLSCVLNMSSRLLLSYNILEVKKKEWSKALLSHTNW